MIKNFINKHKRKKLVKEMPVTTHQIEELLYSLEDSTKVDFFYYSRTGMASIKMLEYSNLIIEQFQKRVDSEYKDFQAVLRIYHTKSKNGSVTIEHYIGIHIQDAIAKKEGIPRKDLFEEATIKYVANF